MQVKVLAVAEELGPSQPAMHFFAQGAGYPVGSRRSGSTNLGRSSFAVMRQEIRH